MGLDLLLGVAWPIAVRLLDGLAQVCEDRAEYPQARRLCERALRILDTRPQSARRDTLRVRTLSQLGTLDRIEARYDQAEQLRKLPARTHGAQPVTSGMRCLLVNSRMRERFIKASARVCAAD